MHRQTERVAPYQGESVMKRLLLVLAAAIVLALALAVPAFAADPVPTAGYVPSGDASSGVPIEEGPLAQSFIAEVGGRLAAADAYLLTFPGDPGSISAELYEITGDYGSTSVPTGSPLAVSTPVDANGLSGFTTFTFSESDVILEAGHPYALVLTSGSPYVGWALGTDAPASLGNRFSYDTVTGWTILAGDGCGFYFRVHVAEAVNEAPAITSVDNATFTEGIPNEFTFTATGYPKPALSSAGSLPSGVSLEDNGNGTATLSGTPAAGASWYVYHITITATNGVDPAATQDFTLTVNPLPTIASDDHCTFTVGTEGTFDVMYFNASGTVCSGDLPSGVTFNGFLGDTYGSFFGTPDPGTGGVYNVTLTTSGPYRPATQEFTLTVNEAPAITTQPTGQTVSAGQTASFSASATGYPLPTVQWQVSTDGGGNWSDIGGAIDAAYSTGATSAGMNGYRYRAMFSNGVGDPVYSDAALLTVLSGVTAPVITHQPTGQTVLFGQRATFTAAADGNPAPTVRWQLSTDRGRHWSDIRGATFPSYTTPATTLGMSGYLYRAVFKNSVGSVTSDAARLTVNPIAFKVLVGTLQWTGPSHGKYHATVSLSITDPSGTPMAANNVKITGVWKTAGGRVLGTSSGTTDDHGVLQLSVHEFSAQPATFVVTSATKTGYSWQK
jgi:hypothetical protein